MKLPHKCSECDRKPLEAPDGSNFLFPRCELCRGKGGSATSSTRPISNDNKPHESLGRV